MKLDAHCHTDCSDGNITIEERIALIRRLGYGAATITDHDFISMEQVQRAKAAAGDLPFIPAAEFSAIYRNHIVHVLGYFLEVENVELQSHILRVQAVDKAISGQILASFQTRGAKFELDEVVSHSLHTFYSMQLVRKISAELFENDPANTMTAFLDILDELGINYANFTPWPVAEVIALIHHANGIAVLAHPGGRNDASMRKLGFYLHDRAAIEKYVDWGLDGMETRTPVHTPVEIIDYEKIARELGLLMTSGSDCHGEDDYLGPLMMGKFTDLFQDGYDRLLIKWKERTE